MRPDRLDSMTDAWERVAYDLSHDGVERTSRNGKVLEILGYAFRLTDPYNAWVGSTRKASRTYAAGELLWYLAGSDDGDQIRAYAPSYSAFLNNGRAYGAYGKRWQQHNQLESMWDLIKRDPETRQAVVSCWHPSDLAAAAPGTVKDVPCTLALNFQPRGNELNLIVTMRSNDWWLGLPYDAWCFTAIQVLMAAALKMQVGFYQHQVGSIHVYENRWSEWTNVADAALKPGDRSLPGTRHGCTAKIQCWGDFEQQVRIATLEERRIRLNEGGPRVPSKSVIDALGGPESLLSMAVIEAAKKFASEPCSGQ